MIKLGEKRINPGNIKIYCPQDELSQEKFSIKFNFIDQSTEIIEYETIKERDDMLHLLDNHFLTFDDGKVISSDSNKLPQFIIDDSDLGGSGQGGMSMQ